MKIVNNQAIKSNQRRTWNRERACLAPISFSRPLTLRSTWNWKLKISLLSPFLIPLMGGINHPYLVLINFIVWQDLFVLNNIYVGHHDKDLWDYKTELDKAWRILKAAKDDKVKVTQMETRLLHKETPVRDSSGKKLFWNNQQFGGRGWLCEVQ